jgi:hypothetical protein
MVNGIADTCAPIYTPPLTSNAYSVLYTGSNSNGLGTGTDDFHILSCFGAGAPATYTLPQSTSTVFPPGHGVGIKNACNYPLTVTSASFIYGAPGVVNGNPASLGGQFVLFPGGEAWLQADPSNHYLVTGFVPGTWYQFANNVPLLRWTGLGGYPEYRLICSGLILATSGDHFSLQLAYGGTFQTTGYQYVKTSILQTISTAAVYTSSGTQGPTGTGDTAIVLTDSIDSTTAAADGTTLNLLITTANGTGAGNKVVVTGIGSWNASGGPAYEGGTTLNASGPYSTSANLTGIQIIDWNNSSANFTGMCRLEPVT